MAQKTVLKNVKNLNGEYQIVISFGTYIGT